MLREDVGFLLFAASARSSNGSDTTHCLTGALGKIRSTSVAASLHNRRDAQVGQGLVRYVALRRVGRAHESTFRCFAMPEMRTENARAFDEHRPYGFLSAGRVAASTWRTPTVRIHAPDS
ncbi:hypothetical protein WMF26_00925 [Sorangium sp. So ce185]|uniref:hypothetical protein n=1 Tax=Sorangium sp. So ce185 TaxID=3133287 RepID=UPI003F62BB08